MSMTPPADAPVPKPKRNNSVLVVVIVLCVVAVSCVFLIAALAAVLFPAFRQARLAARRTQAMTRMRSLAVAMLQYASDNDGRLPIADVWMDGIAKFGPNRRDFYSPGLDRAGPFGASGYGIAFMKSLSSAKLATINQPTERVMIFDSKLTGRNATSGLETVPKPPRFGKAETGGNVFAFVDGHVRLVSASDAVNLK